MFRFMKTEITKPVIGLYGYCTQEQEEVYTPRELRENLRFMLTKIMYLLSYVVILNGWDSLHPLKFDWVERGGGFHNKNFQ